MLQKALGPDLGFTETQIIREFVLTEQIRSEVDWKVLSLPRTYYQRMSSPLQALEINVCVAKIEDKQRGKLDYASYKNDIPAVYGSRDWRFKPAFAAPDCFPPTDWLGSRDPI